LAETLDRQASRLALTALDANLTPRQRDGIQAVARPLDPNGAHARKKQRMIRLTSEFKLTKAACA
jgi:hypothetical protein